MSILWIEELSDFLPRLEDCVDPLPLPLEAALFRPGGILDSFSCAIRCSRFNLVIIEHVKDASVKI